MAPNARVVLPLPEASPDAYLRLVRLFRTRMPLALGQVVAEELGAALNWQIVDQAVAATLRGTDVAPVVEVDGDLVELVTNSLARGWARVAAVTPAETVDAEAAGLLVACLQRLMVEAAPAVSA